MLDILFALGFAGCVYGLARVMGREPRFCRVAGWTALAMFAIAGYGELSVVVSGEASPDMWHMIPLLFLAVLMFRIRRDSEVVDTAPDSPDPELSVQGGTQSEMPAAAM
jgi:hypothetical protein